MEDNWPDDPIERIEAKVDHIMSNHLPHLHNRVRAVEQAIIEKNRWAFWTGIATLSSVMYLVLR